MRRLLPLLQPSGVPETELPLQALGFRVQLYGMTRHRDLFTQRQLVALNHVQRPSWRGSPARIRRRCQPRPRRCHRNLPGFRGGQGSRPEHHVVWLGGSHGPPARHLSVDKPYQWSGTSPRLTLSQVPVATYWAVWNRLCEAGSGPRQPRVRVGTPIGCNRAIVGGPSLFDRSSVLRQHWLR